MAGKKALYYEEALNYYLEGKSQKWIAEFLGVSEQTITKWKQGGNWEEKFKDYACTPGGTAEILRESIFDLIRTMKEQGVDPSKADALKKLSSTYKDLKIQEDYLGICLRVMKAFVEFIKEAHPKAAETVKPLIREFLDKAEQER